MISKQLTIEPIMNFVDVFHDPAEIHGSLDESVVLGGVLLFHGVQEYGVGVVRYHLFHALAHEPVQRVQLQLKYFLREIYDA